MTRRQQRAIGRYAKKIAPLLGITEWIVYVHTDPPPNEESIAHCGTVPGQKVAHLRFSPDFLDCSPEDQRETVIHELLHVVHAVTQDQVQLHLANHMDANAHAVFAELWNQAHEFAVDSLSVSVAPLFPLPEIP